MTDALSVQFERCSFQLVVNRFDYNAFTEHNLDGHRNQNVIILFFTLVTNYIPFMKRNSNSC